MRALFLALGLVLTFCDGAFADATSDCEQDKDRDLSIRSCTRIIEGGVKGDKASAYSWRGSAYDNKDDYDRAIADYDQAIRLDPNEASLYFNRGVAHENKEPLSDEREGYYARAIADYDQAIRLDPKFAPAYYRRGSAFWNMGDDEHAIADYDRAISLDPNDSEFYLDRGLVYRDKGDYDRAIADYDQAIRLDPKNEQAYRERIYAYTKKGDDEHAIADYDEIIRLNPKDGPAYFGRGNAYKNKGDYARAIADYDEALRLKPNYKEAAQNRDITLAKIEEIAKARLAGEKLTQPSLAPRNPVSMGRRVALVIGNAGYKAVDRLANPRNDASAVAGGLRRLGFEVIEKYDLGVTEMRRALGQFEDKATGSEWALVYFSGHGMELNGKNWLIPIDAELARATDVPDEAVALDRVMDRVRGARKLRIVILDACRNNPYRSRMIMTGGVAKAVERGFAPVEPSHGEVVFYAARDGSVALDGTGANSPFAAALVRHMDEDGVELGRFFRRVTSSVLAATGNHQEPFVYGRIPDEDFYFKPAR